MNCLQTSLEYAVSHSKPIAHPDCGLGVLSLARGRSRLPCSYNSSSGLRMLAKHVIGE